MNTIPIKHHDEDLQHLVSPPDISDETAIQAARAATRRVGRIRLRQPDESAAATPMPLSWEDIQVQRIMGVGGFAAVSLVRVEKLDQQRKRPYWYALKCLNQTSCQSDSKTFVKAASDLYTEGELLARIRHPNIVQIHGTSEGGTDHHYQTFQQPGGYFLVLQCMKRTLDDMLRTWQKDKPKNVPSVQYRISNIAWGVASAMDYLHQHHIIFRDLKPQNIGIDYQGNVRIFDFGIAMELPEVGQETLSHGSCVGSLRYMAPELLIRYEASFASDVFAFGILLWQLFALQKPYGDEMTLYQEFRQQVGYLQARPKPMPQGIDDSISSLIQESWHAETSKRPSFGEIIDRLKLSSSSILRKNKGKSSTSMPMPKRTKSLLVNALFRRKSRRRVMQSS